MDAELTSQLLASAVAGDVHALEKLLFCHYDRLHRFVERRIPAELRRSISADDVVQETQIRAYRSIGEYKPKGQAAFLSWLAAIANNQLMDAIRRERSLKRAKDRQIACNDSWGACLLARLPGGDPTGSWVASRKEVEQAVRTALAGLRRSEQREALELRFFKGLSWEETAEQMKRSKGAVQMLCSRGVKELQEALGRMSSYLSGRAGP